MEESNVEKSEENLIKKDLKLEQCVSTNWHITQDNKKLCDTVSTIHTSKAPKRLTLDYIVSDSCLILQPQNANDNNQETACIVDINLKDGQRISRIGVVSEGAVLEFFKESGEYAGTIFSELIEEYEDATVFLAEYSFERPTAQASVKFTRIQNYRQNMYLYGIKLVMEDEMSVPKDQPRLEDILKTAYRNNKKMDVPSFTNIPQDDADIAHQIQMCLGSFMSKALSPRQNSSANQKNVATSVEEEKNVNVSIETEMVKKSNIELCIETKIHEMERRLLKRIDEVEANTNTKLDAILRHLESRSSTS